MQRKQTCNRRMNQDSSWESSAIWYNDLVKHDGHYYHQHVIIPSIIDSLRLDPQQDHSLIDIGCGQCFLSNYIHNDVKYTGLDLSPSLLQMAKKTIGRLRSRSLIHHDATLPFDCITEKFSHATAILSLQNMEDPATAIKNTAEVLMSNGNFIAVINHPCFRIPRMSTWEFDESKKMQYRRIDSYMSPASIPIMMNPGRRDSTFTKSFHFPISYWMNAFTEANMQITEVRELISNKEGYGARAKAENRSRKEFPLFLVIKAKKM